MERAAAAFMALLAALADRLLAFLAGSATQQSRSLSNELEAVERAAERNRADRNVPFDERVQHLAKRGRVRGLQRQSDER